MDTDSRRSQVRRIIGGATLPLAFILVSVWPDFSQAGEMNPLDKATSLTSAGTEITSAGAVAQAPPKQVFRLPTAGGNVWWVDVWGQDGYRIQTHKITGWRRLIDPANVLIVVGDFDDCAEALAKELETPPKEAPVNFNINFPTLGGLQFWGDEFYGHGWKIQKNAITGHYRLLDPGQTRRAWGNYEQCLSEYRRLAPARAPGRSATLVIVLHGIVRTPHACDKMVERLRQEGYEGCNLSYPSTQVSIPDHGAQVNRLLERLEGYDHVYFVAHSLGGLVVRTALQERADKRVQAIVTLGTPHKGAVLADMLKDWFPYKVIYGPSGRQLITGSASYAASLGPPPCPMACIAGGKGDGKGYSPLMKNDNDGIVEIGSALYEGACDTLVVNSLHSFMMNNDAAIEATVRFLKTGSFNAKTQTGESARVSQ